MVRVLIVDNSPNNRIFLKNELPKHCSAVEVIAAVPHGRLALRKLEQHQVDVIILDMEMPEMNGIQLLKELKKNHTDIQTIMFSTCTRSGSESTLEALSHGATDFLEKPQDLHKMEDRNPFLNTHLIPKILGLVKKNRRSSPSLQTDHVEVETDRLATTEERSQKTHQTQPSGIKNFIPSAVVIASSTGGPNALGVIASMLKAPIRIPIFIAQHMPALFTQSLADRLARTTGLPVVQAEHNQKVETNTIYIAPGDFHLRVKNKQGGVFCQLDQGPRVNSVRPAADLLFESCSQVYKHKLMGYILTGMGNDGVNGADAVRSRGGKVMIQDEASSVVWGMPGAAFERGSFDAIGSLEDCGRHLERIAHDSLAHIIDLDAI